MKKLITIFTIIFTLGVYSDHKEEVISLLIKSGVSAKGTNYEKQYHDYWDPIMAEHQKKADAMK